MTGHDRYGGADGEWREDRDIVDSRTADRLRRALNAEAATVTPGGDGLSRIRARTARASWRPAWLVPVAAGMAGVVVAGGVALAALDDSTETPVAAETMSATPTPSTEPLLTPTVDPNDLPSTTAPSPTVGEPDPDSREVALPVYYVGSQPSEDGASGPRFVLFREFHHTAVANDIDAAGMVELAVAEMFLNAPVDPDYGGLWPPSATIRGASVDDDTGVITVDLSDVTLTDVRGVEERILPQAAAAAVQQLVYTATAAGAYAGMTNTHLSVEIHVDGEPVTSFLGTDAAEPLSRDVDARGAIWILSIAEGDDLLVSVDDGETITKTIVVKGEANMFEGGPATWELRRGDEVVDEGLVSTAQCCAWLPFDFDLELTEPGTYTIEVYDAGGVGREQAPYDSKTFQFGINEPPHR